MPTTDATAIRFGTAAVPGPGSTMQAVAEWASHLERSGLDLIGVADSPSLEPKPFIALATVATATRTATIGPWVTNPVLRHPIVLASGISAAQAAAPGRVVVGIGTGDSALHNAGLRPATLATTAAFLEAVRALLADGSAE